MKFYTPFKISENISETPEGFLLCSGVAIARTGEMDYGHGETPLEVGPDGRVKVLREAAEVFRAETIASFEGKAVTILHPSDFVSPSNWASLAKGVVQNVRRGSGEQENDLVADLLITDSVAIGLVKNGLREVSCGYEAEYTQTGAGRGVQTNIIGNHLALVQEGRAGASYAINDHNGKGSKMKLSDKIKAIFAKAQDEAIKIADGAACDVNTETPETKEGFMTMKDMKGYFDEKFEAMSKGTSKDEGGQQDPQSGKPATPVAKDEGADPMMAMDERLKKLEGMVADLVGKQTGDKEDGDMDETDDEDESEDDDFEASPAAGETGDTASRVEILAPGMNSEQKGVKAKALIACYATKDGKAVIDQFTGGKLPNVKDEKYVDLLFVGVSENLKAQRQGDLSGSRTSVRDQFLSGLTTPKGAKSAEDINAINAKHYGK